MQTYYADLVGRPGITCSAPGVFRLGMASPDYVTSVYYAVCANTQALIELVPNHDLGAICRTVSRETSVCNRCLPPAPPGQVYVIWTDGVEPNGTIGANCPTACMLAPGI
jgi:hypothetical protein